MFMALVAEPCGATGVFLGAGVPPDRPPPPNSTNWSPFLSQAHFELADLIYREARMSKGLTNKLFSHTDSFLRSMNASTEAPFKNFKDMCSTIDRIKVGDLPWQTSSVGFSDDDGNIPGEDDPNFRPFMTQEYEVNYRDPLEVVKHMLSNPNFRDGFDYAPFRDYNGHNNKRRWRDMMSGDWAWHQAVRGEFLRGGLKFVILLVTHHSGLDFGRPKRPWLDACSYYTGERQDNRFGCYGAERFLPALLVDWQCS